MAVPTNQVFREGEASYRYMAHPLPKQPLQTLYPGRFMEQNYHYTGDNIPNEDFIGALQTQQMSAALSKAADYEREALERHLGGRPKMAVHPPVEPEATLEDPDLRSLTVDLRGDSEDLEKIPDPAYSLPVMETVDRSIANRIRAEAKNMPYHHSPQNAGQFLIENYQYEKSPPAQCGSCSPVTSFDVGMTGMLGFFILIVLLLFCFRK